MLFCMDDRRRCMRDIVRYCWRAPIRLAALSAMSPIAPLLSGAGGGRLLVLNFAHRVGHRRQLRLDRPNDLRREEALADGHAARVADRLLQVARPDVLDQEDSRRVTGLERPGHVLDLGLCEPEGAVAAVCGRGRGRVVALELEAEQGAGDPAEVLTLVVERQQL